MAENCELCHKAANNDQNIIYDDDKVVCMLEEHPASKGQIIIFTKNHYPIIENVPDEEIKYVFSVANRMSVFVFEALGAKGTNIIVNNGISAGQKYPHFSVSIIPRDVDDGIDIMWDPKKADEEILSTVELALLDALNNGGTSQPEQVVENHEPEHLDDSDGDNYLIKQLRRIP